MLTRLCLVRHGETAWNAERRLQGHTDIPLNAHGIAQAQATAASLAGERFDAAYSSDLARARQTAEAIAGRCLLTPAFDERLRERHYGAFQSLTYDEARERFPDDYHRFKTRDPGFALSEGGESLIEFAERVRSFTATLSQYRQLDHLLIVGHQGVLSLLIAQLLNMPDSAMWRFPIEHGAWSAVDLQPDFATLRVLNSRAVWLAEEELRADH